MVPQLNSFAAIGMIPLGDVIFGKKGVITEIATSDDLKSTVAEKVSDTVHSAINAVTPSFPSLSDMLGVKTKIHEIAAEMHSRALLTPDLSDDKIDFVKELYNGADKSLITHFMPEWFKEIIIYITAVMGELTHNAVQSLLRWIYNIISSIVLWTPEFLFENDWFSETVGKFSGISVGIVVIFTMIEGLKKIFRLDHTPFREILKKFPIALIVSACTPILFSKGVHYLNMLTHFILDIGKNEIGSTSLTGILTTTGLIFEPANIFLMLIFAILFLALCIPMTFFHAKRWFDLLVAGVLTPFAMSAYLFRNTEHYFRLWLTVIKSAATKQLIYAVFVTILGLIMFATPNPTTFVGMLTKLLVMLGALHRLAFPPNFVKNMSSGADNKTLLSMFKDLNNKKNELDETRKKTQKGAENGLIKSAEIAGKVFRKLFK